MDQQNELEPKQAKTAENPPKSYSFGDRKPEYSGAPDWACIHYGGYEHDWLDCPDCLEGYDEYINKE